MSGQPNRQFLLNMMPKESICAEIGVARGNFSEKILKTVNPERLYLVDPWFYDKQAHAYNRFYGGKGNSQAAMDKVHDDVVFKFRNKPQVKIWRSRSDMFFTQTSDEYFDWVYIDGNHDFAPCLCDILLAIDKVKIGGFVCGDDVNWGEAKLKKPVRRAVEVVENHEPRLELVYANPNRPKEKFTNNQFIFKRVK